MLVELSVMEQRYRAVLEVEAGFAVTEVAERFGVSRQAACLAAPYREGGLAGLADRSRRPRACPDAGPAGVEALVCRVAGRSSAVGSRCAWPTIGRRGIDPVPSQATLYRILVRNALIIPRPSASSALVVSALGAGGADALWQMDVMGGVFLADGTECKLVTGIDDHSRFVVIARLVPRASARAVCAALVQALGRFGVREEVLTDNGKQFTGRFTKPRPAEVLFERICRENGITVRTTRPRSPTTTGKIERWHRTLREEFLADAEPFADLATAQAKLDAWVEQYNTVRPHQSLDMATPAQRFGAARTQPDPQLPPVKVPAELALVLTPRRPATPTRHRHRRIRCGRWSSIAPCRPAATCKRPNVRSGWGPPCPARS